jgi:hypothetical protein
MDLESILLSNNKPVPPRQVLNIFSYLWKLGGGGKRRHEKRGAEYRGRMGRERGKWRGLRGCNGWVNMIKQYACKNVLMKHQAMDN